ncbi:hypothetical protein [Williamsia sp. CHRR-6]|uniref:hypothetical protein n=1 Tax=Williamsia sp. CHRR-6 TaxID=2835871 RepID=UPI001BDA85F5|nr:hypothetical protein [Williamsia sp. CHRR-6]MBT0568645.1 hypothetical protein [Williamsia sp. CHRR-6]
MSSPVERELRRAVSDAVPVPSVEDVEVLVAEGARPAAQRSDVSFRQAPGLD